jgi:hypothetical protein
MTTSQRRNDHIEVVNQKESHFFIVENEIVTEYRPIIGATGYDLYGFYSQMANRKKNNSLYPSMQLISAHLGYIRSTLSQYNWLLEWCGLLRIESGIVGEKNIYYLLPVKPITPELLIKLTQVLQPDDKDSKEWARFKANRLEAVKAWQPLCAHFKAPRSAPKTAPALTNGHAPHAESADLPSQAEIVNYMINTFYDGQKPLSEAAAIKMIEQYGIEAVRQQLAWLPNRVTDTPLRTLRAALKGKWLEPKAVGKAEPKAWWDDGQYEVGEDGLVRPKDPFWERVKDSLQKYANGRGAEIFSHIAEIETGETAWTITHHDSEEEEFKDIMRKVAQDIGGENLVVSFARET